MKGVIEGEAGTVTTGYGKIGLISAPCCSIVIDLSRAFFIFLHSTNINTVDYKNPVKKFYATTPKTLCFYHN